MVAMGNSGDENSIPYVKACLQDEEPLVRAHAAWALWKLDGHKSKEILSKHRLNETDEMVNEEIGNILSSP
jgi:epoxyqueuosine reductase